MAPAPLQPSPQKDASGFPQNPAPRQKPPTLPGCVHSACPDPRPRKARVDRLWLPACPAVPDPRGVHGSPHERSASYHNPAPDELGLAPRLLTSVSLAPPGPPFTSLRASPNGRAEQSRAEQRRAAPRRQLPFEILHQPITEKFIPPAPSLYGVTYASGTRRGDGNGNGHAHSEKAKPKMAILTNVNGLVFFFAVPFPEVIQDAILPKGKWYFLSANYSWSHCLRD